MPNQEYLEKALEIADYNTRIDNESAEFRRRVAIATNTYNNMMRDIRREQDRNRIELEKEKAELMQGEEFLSDGFYLRLGDIIDELGSYIEEIYQIPKPSFQVEIESEDDVIGDWSLDKLVSYVKKFGDRIFNNSVWMKIKSGSFEVEIRYRMDYNMPQADNTSFVDHLDSDTFMDDGVEYTKFVCDSKTANLADVFVAIPYGFIAKECDYFGCIYDEKGKFCFGIEFPHDSSSVDEQLFRTCIIRCAKKRDFGPIRKRDKKEDK